tara:strand:- start:1365 stop:2351 length:987 start_codon:yes stop_codon:yes gene_type:complete
MLENKTLLITGGTGSLGNALVKTILVKYKNIKKLIIFSRDELKQHEMEQKYNSNKLRFFLGDVRDPNRLFRALNEVNIVIHAAALKQVPASEYNPTEFIDTNILGAKNLLEQSFNNKVETIVALSTDKAAAPINLYGATKLCSDKLFVSSNQYYGNKMKSSIVRYGNVMNSRGSVLPIFISHAKKNAPFPITDEKMTRFNISIEDGVKMILFAIKNAKGGEIFVPKLPSFKILDLAKAIKKDFKMKKIGIRAGEKLHEDIITKSDGLTTIDFGKYYAILPSSGKNSIHNYSSNLKFKKVPKNFSYYSGNNKFLTVEELRKIISELSLK